MKRVGLVLGAGGVAGHSFHAGALCALADVACWDARDAELIVGTSAGSGVGAQLRGGRSPEDLFAISTDTTASKPWPRPRGIRPRPASPRVLLQPWRTRPGVLVASLFPLGTLPTTAVGDRVRPLYTDASGWPEKPLWICAVRLDTGRRTVFGRDPTPTTDVVTAVEASSAIPGYFRPVVIDGVRYVDGGAHSPTNADLVAGLGLDLVYVLSPMSGRPTSSFVRRAHGRQLAREVAAVRRKGTEVVVLEPGPADLAAMGPNPMDVTRRADVARTARDTLRRYLDGSRVGLER